MELFYRHLYRVIQVAHKGLSAAQKTDAAVFKATERKIAFGQKISASAGRIKECKGTEFFLKDLDFFFLLLAHSGISLVKVYFIRVYPHDVRKLKL